MIGIIIGLIILGISAFLFLVVYILYRITFRSPFKKQLSDFNLPVSKNYQSYPKFRKDLIDKFMAKSYEDAYINSYDELRLHARVYLTRGANNKVAILCHGYRGTAFRDFCAASRVLFELKYNIILIDQRGHGLSDGHKITFGIRESKDVMSWIKYAKERFGQDTELLLFGVSMGGHTILNIADQLDENVKLIADSPYTSPKEIIVNSIKSIHLPAFIVYPLVNLAAIIFLHENMNRNNLKESLSKSSNQILIIHGNKDEVVPYEDSMYLSARYASRVRYELFKGGKHAISYMVDYDRYAKAIKDFLEERVFYYQGKLFDE